MPSCWPTTVQITANLTNSHIWSTSNARVSVMHSSSQGLTACICASYLVRVQANKCPYGPFQYIAIHLT